MFNEKFNVSSIRKFSLKKKINIEQFKVNIEKETSLFIIFNLF